MRSLALTLAICMIHPAQAYQGFDVCNRGKQTVDSVICYEPTVLIDTTITGDVKVVGSLTAKGINANNLVIKGSTDLANSKINGTTDLIGNLKTSGLDFKKGVTVEANDINLSKTVIRGSLFVSSKTTAPHLSLSCKSTIVGSVMFDGKPGLVDISEDSIIQGKVINGNMNFVKVDCPK